MGEKLVFVYNADSGLLNLLIDAAHKIFSPTTYPCNLCALTYTPTGLPRWRRFIKTLPWPVEFLHKDEFVEQYGVTKVNLPAAFLWDGQKLQPWIDADAMNGFTSLDELITAVATQVKEAEIVNR